MYAKHLEQRQESVGKIRVSNFDYIQSHFFTSSAGEKSIRQLHKWT
jgi:hypothetical protein